MIGCMAVDDLGHPARLAQPPRRVVSLVPSLTEAVAATAPDSLIGATDWCTRPSGLDVVRVRGTKNPNIHQIVELAPDLVIANQEENRELDVRRLREAGINVWVTHINTVDEALTSMTRLFSECFAVQPDWLAQARRVWAQPLRPSGLRVAVPIWKDPYMWLGSPTYASDVLAHLGFANVFEQMGRYPHAEAGDSRVRNADLVVLPDEPYPFSASDGPTDFPHHTVGLIEGRHLFWYGPAMLPARDALIASLAP